MANVISTLLKMDSTQFKTGLKGAQQSIKETDGVVNKAKAGWSSAFAGFASSPIVIGAATTAVTAFAAQSVAAASDLEESINAVNVTFGESADKILEFGDNAAKSVGLAKAEFNGLATPLGSILKNAGFQLDDVADKTIVLTQRAADMASVFNTDVSDALGAIQAGLRGEQDPLEKYGVSLSAAKVEARALADTGKATVKALTDQEKQLARVEIILDQTNQTAGDFKKTSGDLANQTRILKAEFTNLEAQAGQDLIPTLSLLAGALIKIHDGIEGINDIPIIGGNGGPSLTDMIIGQVDPVTQLRNIAGGWDEFKKSISGAHDEIKRIESDRGADSINDLGTASAAAAKEAADAADEVADLGDKAANSGPKIGDMAGALADAEQNLADLNQEARDTALDELAAAAKAVGDAVDTAFAKIRDDLDLQDLVDNITDDFGAVAEAQDKITTDGEAGVRNYRRSVRDLQRDLLNLLNSIDGIPPDKKVQIAAQIETGSIDDLYRILGDLTKGVVIPVSFATASNPSFSGLNGVFSPTAAPSAPTLSNPNPAPASSSTYAPTIINYYPVGTTPTTQYQNGVIDDRRNGVR